MPDLVALLPLVGIALLFWLFIVRPQSRRQQQLRSVHTALQVGDQVLLAAGLYGTVRSVADERVGVELSEGVVVTAARGAIVQVLDGKES